MVVHWDPTSFKVKVDVYKIPRLHISISWILFWARFQWISKHCMKLEFESSNNSTYPNGQYFPKYIVYNTKLTFFIFCFSQKTQEISTNVGLTHGKRGGENINFCWSREPPLEGIFSTMHLLYKQNDIFLVPLTNVPHILYLGSYFVYMHQDSS